MRLQSGAAFIYSSPGCLIAGSVRPLARKSGGRGPTARADIASRRSSCARKGANNAPEQGGGEIQLELSKLGAIDQRVIADLEARKVTAPQAMRRETHRPRQDRLVEGAQHFRAAGAGEWKITPPASSGAMFTTPPKAITTIPRFDFFDAFTSLVVNTAAKKAAVGRMQKGPGSNKAISRAVLWDLQSGKAISPTGLPGEMLPLALADDGQQVLMRRNEFFFKDRLEVWVPQGGKFAKTLEWTPYDDAKDAARNVRWAEFIDASTLATANNTGKVVLWSFPDVNPLCTFETGNNCVPASVPIASSSPGRMGNNWACLTSLGDK